MATQASVVYGAFFARILEDDWLNEEDEQVVNQDLLEILKMAIFSFRFCRIKLTLGTEEETGEDIFINDLGNDEVQVLAICMKLEWLRRQINTYRLIKQQYSTKDFAFSSQANHLNNLLKSLEFAEKEQKTAFDFYNRVRDGSVYPYRNFAGGEISE